MSEGLREALNLARVLLDADRQALYESERDPDSGLVEDEQARYSLSEYDRALAAINREWERMYASERTPFRFVIAPGMAESVAELRIGNRLVGRLIVTEAR